MDKWFWFGVTIDGAGHVKLRQYRIWREATGYGLDSWSKGIAGTLWHTHLVSWFDTFEGALEGLREQMRKWCGAYSTVDEGEPAEQVAADMPQGLADPGWWAEVLGVSVDADAKTVKSAFHQRAKETHPDMGGDAEAFMRVYAAYEYWKEL